MPPSVEPESRLVPNPRAPAMVVVTWWSPACAASAATAPIPSHVRFSRDGRRVRSPTVSVNSLEKLAADAFDEVLVSDGPARGTDGRTICADAVGAAASVAARAAHPQNCKGDRIVATTLPSRSGRGVRSLPGREAFESDQLPPGILSDEINVRRHVPRRISGFTRAELDFYIDAGTT